MWVEEGQLRFRSPKGALSPDEFQRLRQLKEEIIELLQSDPTETPVLRRHGSVPSAFPFTSLQQLIWSRAGRYGAWARSHACITRVTGDLHAELLAKAVRRLTERHAILRTRLSLSNGSPLQSIDEESSSELRVVDLAPADTDVESRVADFLDARIGIGAPLFEARLFRLGNDDSLFALSLDQTITDCRSTNLLSRQVWDEYIQEVRGGAPQVDEAPFQFADYALWLSEFFPHWESSHAARWRTRFLDVIPQLISPSEKGSSEAAESWETTAIHFDAGATNQVATFARDHDVYPAFILLTAYIAAASHYARRSDVVVAVIDNGRYRPELESMLGPLIQLLHLRLEVRTEQTFAGLLQAVIAQLHEAYQHRDFNWLRMLVPTLNPQLYFNWLTESASDSLPPEALSAGAGIRLQPYALQRTGLPFGPMTLTLRHSGNIHGELTHAGGSALVARTSLTAAAPFRGSRPESTTRAASQTIRLLHAVTSGGICRPEATIGSLLGTHV